MLGIRVESLTKVYDGDVRGLSDVTLSFETGVLGLLGPNGSGKTTLMRILATLLDATSGRAWLDDLDVAADRAQVRRILGYLPQEFGLYPEMTCREFLDYIGLLYGLGGAERRRAIEETLHNVHIDDVADRRIKTLSGGMKQRLGIGQAVLSGPRLVIVDEPTVGLDPEERIRVRNLITELAQNRVVILSTHIVGDVSSAAHCVALLRKGELAFMGTPAELAAEARGKVWRARVEPAKLNELKTRCLISGISHSEAGLEARLLADDPSCLPGVLEAHNVEPELEDAYIWKMGDRTLVETV